MNRFWSWRGAALRARRESAAPAKTAETVHACCDDEELAAFLDGRLGGRERAKLLAHLAKADDAYQVFASTTAIMSEGEALLERMQAPEVRAATRRAFDASPEDLRKAAIEAARSSGG